MVTPDPNQRETSNPDEPAEQITSESKPQDPSDVKVDIVLEAAGNSAGVPEKVNNESSTAEQAKAGTGSGTEADLAAPSGQQVEQESVIEALPTEQSGPTVD
jgi:hypothetical protein